MFLVWRPRVMWAVWAAWAAWCGWSGPAPTLAQDAPPSAYLGERCEGFRGVEGTCTTISCPTLIHELNSLPLPVFVSRHGRGCDYDVSGNKLVCCPSNSAEFAARSCGKSTLGQHQRSGVANPGAWPWHVEIFYLDEFSQIGYSSIGCVGVLVSDRHVVTHRDCGHNEEVHIILGATRIYNLTDTQIIISRVSVIALGWGDQYHEQLAVLILETPAVITPDKVMPVCLTSNPEKDLGYSLQGLTENEKQLAFLPYWPSFTSDADYGTLPLHQTQAFISNCTAFCQKKPGDETDPCPFFNVTLGDANLVCLGGVSVSECSKQMGMHGSPIVVESRITGEYYLAGILASTYCRDDKFSHTFIPILPLARDITSIVQTDRWL